MDKNRRLVQPLLYTDLYRWHSPICTNATGDEHGGCIRGIGYPRPSSAIPYTTDKCPLILYGIIGFNRAQVIGAIMTPHSIHLTPQGGNTDPSPTTRHPSNKGPGIGVGVVSLTGVQGRTVIKPSDNIKVAV